MDENHEETEVGRRGTSYDEAFERDAVRLVSEETYSFKLAVATVGVSEQSLRLWHAKFAPATPPCGENASVQELRDEVARLRNQLTRVELEREMRPIASHRTSKLEELLETFYHLQRPGDIRIRYLWRMWYY